MSEKNNLMKEMKPLKETVDDLKSKERILKNLNIEENLDKYEKYIDSFKDNPEKIKYIKKDQTVSMLENVFSSMKHNLFCNYELLNYCNPELINESLLLKILPKNANINIKKDFLDYVPKHCINKSLYIRIKKRKMLFTSCRKISIRKIHD